MLILTGNNLGERHKQLNFKVKEAVSNNVDFEQIKDKPEQSDIDKLFKIDLASKHMNIEYMVEVLKSGDSLYISRALKSAWMYDSEFANIMNVEYLRHNVFPDMSLKMKKKFLTAISTYVRNPERVLAFYNYCMETKLINIALKFLVFTSDEFKLEFLQKNPSELQQLRHKNVTTHFIGASFPLADAYLATTQEKQTTVFTQISYLYAVSNTQYLDMLEKYFKTCSLDYCFFGYPRSNYIYLGLRISKDILTKHKDRVLKMPLLYINILSKSSVVKYSTEDDAKTYIVELLPMEVDEFWKENFWRTYEHVINLLKPEERIEFIKKVFNDKYPGQQFEMCYEFYKNQYYKFMTAEQKNKWALDQVASQKEILGIGKDYIWYKFVSFEKAFEEIKKFIMITPNDVKRAEMIKVLVKAAKTQRDLEKLFNYYTNRHNNEQRYIKENFIDWVVKKHNVYSFDKDCWEAFNTILQNLGVYNILDYNNCDRDIKTIALIYYIVNKIQLHDALKLYITTDICYYYQKVGGHTTIMRFYTRKLNTDKLTKEQQEMVFQYLFNFYMEKINKYDSVPVEDEIKHKLRQYIYFILDLLPGFDRTEKDIPEVVMKLIKLMELDLDEFAWVNNSHYEHPKEIPQKDLLRFLKTDAKLAVESIPLVKQSIDIGYGYELGQFLKKLKVYFCMDIAKDYLKFFSDLLTDPNLYSKFSLAASYGIFQLADNSYKVDFMKMYAPTQNKIIRDAIEERLLNIQQAICATAFYSRPPVPLENMLMYIKGDYVRSCLPLFNSYLVNLPLPLCMKFVEAILDKPLSIQKHGLRLAFECYNSENLKRVILYIWQKSKNVSLRRIIYKALYNKIVREDQNAQIALFETLCALTLELHQDDTQDLFDLLTAGRLPSYLISDYTKAVWTSVSALPKINCNFQRMTAAISYIHNHISSIRQDIVHPIVQEFIKSVFEISEECIDLTSDALNLIKTKWDLTAIHITYVHNKDDFLSKLEITEYILNQCLSNFNLVRNNEYFIRELFFDFLNNLISRTYLDNLETNEYLLEIYEKVLRRLQCEFPLEDVYLITWEIRIYLAARKALIATKTRLPYIKSMAEQTEALREIILNYGRDIGNMIKEYVVTDKYFVALRNDVETVFRRQTEDMTYSIEYDINFDDMYVITSFALMRFKTPEMHSFVVNIVPSDYSRQYEEDYKSVLKQLKALNNIEIKCKLHQKFINTDFKRRSFFSCNS